MSAIARFLFTIFISITLLPIDAYTHGGGLDSNGGHFNRKTGEYHQHRSPAKQANSSPSSRSTTKAVSPSERSQKINEYFRAANENVGALSCGVVIHERNLASSTKKAIKRRDGNCCVICGSTVKLEVDHIRGLQNGGSNDPSNLATLCDDCHTEKTRMDGSLRRKREKICRN